jgi:hypothetical protein
VQDPIRDTPGTLPNPPYHGHRATRIDLNHLGPFLDRDTIAGEAAQDAIERGMQGDSANGGDHGLRND